ncbi:hypothetical protein VB711_26155 [Cronbergia sp. UHCC 0137]|uniref:hypothetical protein n=1 Tax=Cronbergia sp. UHCC 0137 TaxID=3110239 RepID=UPI002B201DE1|nr:hypothetical protein [Cronbergia sp. UHCC 0137]MEA5621292.1 hypothetical protein [Cronbergia sp. UHCC 0137]
MSISLKNLFAGTLVSLGLSFLGTAQAIAASITSTVTADNHYGLFYGNKDGSVLNFVGRNELGSGGSQGGYNWSNPETWNFNVNRGDYLYMVVWDDQSVDESWIGQFEFATGQTLLSKASDWEYMISENSNPFTRAGQIPVNERDSGHLSGRFEGNVPKAPELAYEIQSGNWVNAQRRGANGISPWGVIPNIDLAADFLNVTTADSQARGSSANTDYTIFRTRYSIDRLVPEAIPEPTSLLAIFSVGAISAATLRQNKNKKQA